MSDQHYRTQMNRLAAQFGANVYKPERLAMIWREVGTLSDEAFTRIVDELLFSARVAPIGPEFRELAIRERQREWEVRKAQGRKDAQDFWAGTYQPEDVKMICGFIKRRILREVPDDQWATFIQHLNHTVTLTKGRT